MKNHLVTSLYILSFILSAVLQAQVETTIYWESPKGESAEKLLGLNIWKGASPRISEELNYIDGINYASPGLLRLRAGEWMNDEQSPDQSWINPTAKTWDAVKIARVLASFSEEQQENILINIANWPHWMDTNQDGRLDADKIDDYARWCADLVRIVNIDQKYGIKYWSPFNAIENRVIESPKNIIDLFNQCTRAMKKADPKIKTGGGDFLSTTDLELINTFVENTSPNLDFFSFHYFVTGEKDKPTGDIYNSVTALTNTCTTIKNILNKNGLSSIPLWLTEYNVFGASASDQVRGFQRSSKGAVYNALLLKNLAENEILDGCILWNDCDFNYGIMDTDFELRPTAHLFYLKNRFMNGTVVKTSSKKPGLVSAFAVSNKVHRSVLLINRSDDTHVVNLKFDGWRPIEDNYELFYITNKDFYSVSEKISPDFGKNIEIKQQSLLLYLFNIHNNSSAIDNEDNQPENYFLSQPYPNPFNNTTILQFKVDNSQSVRVLLYNSTGQFIRSIFEGEVRGDFRYTISVEAQDMATGQYLVYLIGEDFNASRALTLVK